MIKTQLGNHFIYMEGSLYVVPGRFRSNLSWLRALSIVHLITGLALVIVLRGDVRGCDRKAVLVIPGEIPARWAAVRIF